MYLWSISGLVTLHLLLSVALRFDAISSEIALMSSWIHGRVIRHLRCRLSKGCGHDSVTGTFIREIATSAGIVGGIQRDEPQESCDLRLGIALGLEEAGTDGVPR